MNKIEFEYEGVWITDPTLDETAVIALSMTGGVADGTADLWL